MEYLHYITGPLIGAVIGYFTNYIAVKMLFHPYQPVKLFGRTLPFTPGKHLEVQNGNDIYRCVLEDGRLAMKFINMIKIFFDLSREQA